jgi:hypothetical protein
MLESIHPTVRVQSVFHLPFVLAGIGDPQPGVAIPASPMPATLIDKVWECFFQQDESVRETE